ncbi:hypothetical protein OH77DRAFT_1523652 [Trametes cingulata]|nr:hypothetical protein OH77DRAFT_1523652 [Trametes cingulata]
MSSSAYDPELTAEYSEVFFENYCLTVSSCLLWYDVVLTFPREVNLIWRRKLNAGSYIYLTTRYIAVIERIFYMLKVARLPLIIPQTCGGLSHTDDILLILNFIFASGFIILAIYGIWGRDWRPLVVLLPLSLMRPITEVFEAKGYTPMQAGPPYGAHPACYRLSYIAESSTIPAYALLIIFTWIKTVRIKRDAVEVGMRSPLLTLLLREGTVYILILLTFEIVSLVLNQTGNSPMGVSAVWPYFQQVIIVIILTRFMLDLRGVSTNAHADEGTTTTLRWSDIRFRTITATILGDLAADADEESIID